jgi:hypothetical protein
MSAPRISVVLLACNQEAWAADAAASVLAQESEPLEIVLSDDASTDRTFDVLQAAADAHRGPHRVRARRNERNLGIGAHWNRLVAETSGSLIVCAAGDDVSLPHRVARLAAAWDASGGTLDLVASHFIDMALDGTPGAEVAIDDLSRLTFERWLERRPFTLGATHLFTRGSWTASAVPARTLVRGPGHRPARRALRRRGDGARTADSLPPGRHLESPACRERRGAARLDRPAGPAGAGRDRAVHGRRRAGWTRRRGARRARHDGGARALPARHERGARRRRSAPGVASRGDAARRLAAAQGADLHLPGAGGGAEASPSPFRRARRTPG